LYKGLDGDIIGKSTMADGSDDRRVKVKFRGNTGPINVFISELQATEEVMIAIHNRLQKHKKEKEAFENFEKKRKEDEVKKKKNEEANAIADTKKRKEDEAKAAKDKSAAIAREKAAEEAKVRAAEKAAVDGAAREKKAQEEADKKSQGSLASTWCTAATCGATARRGAEKSDASAGAAAAAG